jgi:hypothetical protein
MDSLRAMVKRRERVDFQECFQELEMEAEVVEARSCVVISSRAEAGGRDPGGYEVRKGRGGCIKYYGPSD